MPTPEEDQKIREALYAKMRADARLQDEYRALVKPLVEKIIAQRRKEFHLTEHFNLSVMSYQPQRWSVTFVLKSAKARLEAKQRDFLSQLKQEFEAEVALVNRTIGQKQPIEVASVQLADMTEITDAGGFSSFFS